MQNDPHKKIQGRHSEEPAEPVAEKHQNVDHQAGSEPPSPLDTTDDNTWDSAAETTDTAQPETTGEVTDTSSQPPETSEDPESEEEDTPPDHSYYIRFREGDPSYSAASRIAGLTRGEIIMAQTDHGLEPATVTGPGPEMIDLPQKEDGHASHLIVRRANRDEISKFERLMEREKEAFDICQKHIEKHNLEMKLTRVERFFNGSKIIFYFTAENRVDFRELVKDLVQEFRTRVEIRQIGVRHETKMIGGLGCCGRELCCSSFIKDFAPVSIKMAKAQNLPLNPAKISGVCNRLLCCLTYEYDTYRKLRKGMPKLGKLITLDGIEYKVINANILAETVTLMVPGQPEQTKVLTREEWFNTQPKHHEQQQKKPSKGKGAGPQQKAKPQQKKKARHEKGAKPKHKKNDHKKE